MSLSSRTWTPFIPGAAPPLPSTGDGAAGRVVALAVSADAIEDGWASEVALDFARAWARQGRRVVLVDVHLSRPELHCALRLPNDEGLADALLHGAPLRRAIRPIDGGALFFLSAGRPEREAPGAVLGAGRWSRFCDAFVLEGVTLVAQVPAEEPWAEVALAPSTDIVWLAGRSENDPPFMDALADNVRACIEPPLAVGRAPAGPLCFELADDDEDEGEARPPGRRTRLRRVRPLRARARARLMALGALPLTVLFVAALRAAWVPERGSAVSPFAAAVGTDAVPLGKPAAYSVALAAFFDRDDAAAYASQVRLEAPSEWVGVAPLVVNDAVYYRVLAGLEPDSLSADSLRSALAARTGEVASRWIIRRTGLGFLIGEEAALGNAAALVDELNASGISAYVLRVSYSKGSYAYRVYAGAYADEAEAHHLETVLQAQGLEAALTERVGTLDP